MKPGSLVSVRVVAGILNSDCIHPKNVSKWTGPEVKCKQ